MPHIDITIKECSTVRPTSETPKRSLWVSNLDLLVPRVHIPTVYFYRPNETPNFFHAPVLKEALSECLGYFYPVAGRLTRDETGRFEINCNGEGAMFVVAESTNVLDDFNDFMPSPELLQLVPTVDYSQDSTSYPLLVLQVTRFKCGGVCLGIGLHHTLADGLSAIHFINSWSELARGLPISLPPFIERFVLSARDPPFPTNRHTEYDPPLSLNTPLKTQEYQASPNLNSTIALIKITTDHLNTLKIKANSKSDKSPYTSYETLAAHVWRCVTMARGLDGNQATKLLIATDGRTRLDPPLPLGYFGNVLFTATPMARSGDLQSQPLKSTVKIINDALAKLDNDYLRSALDYLEMQPDIMVLTRGRDAFKNPNLNVVSWMRLPLYEADFGWGRPIYMGPANIIYDGLAYILPSPLKDKCFSLAICLESDQIIEAFKKLFYEV